MRWWTAIQDYVTRNGIDAAKLDLDRVLPPVDPKIGHTLGCVPIRGYGGLTGQELAAAGASLAIRPDLPTIQDMQNARERLEVFIERAANDVAVRNLRGDYWDLQSVDVDGEEEAVALAAELDRVGYVEGAAITGWVIRNAAVRARRPIASLARAAEDVSDDAFHIAETVLDSAQRLDPTYGGYVFTLHGRPHDRLRFRDRFGHIWVYGD